LAQKIALALNLSIPIWVIFIYSLQLFMTGNGYLFQPEDGN